MQKPRASARRRTGCGSCTGEFEREYPFGVVRQCLEPVVRRADDRERLLRGAARLGEPVLMGVPDCNDAAPVGLLHGLYWLVANLAEEAPAAIFVDDAHWADEPSLRFLAYLVRRLDSLRVALVICTRRDDDSGGAAGPGMAEVRGEVKRGRLELRPLGPHAVAQLLRDFRSGHVDDEFVGACHEATGGNPFLLEELAHTLMSDDVPFTAEAVERVGTVAPATIAAWVAATLARLGEQAEALARAAAVLGDGAALDLAAEVGGVPTAEATRRPPASSGRASSATNPFARMSPGASAADIADIAGRAARQADALSAQGASSLGFSGMMLALIWTDRLEDALRVGDAAIAAARRSGSTTSFASAITMRAHAHRRAGRLRDAEADARTALEATLDPGWWFARGLAPLLCTLVCQGRAEEAESELAGALQGGDIHESPPMTTVLLARMWVRAARREHGSALADWREALRWIQPRRPNAGWIEDLAVAAEAHMAVGDRDGAVAIIDEATDLAEAWGTPRTRGIALHARARVAGGDDVIDLLRRATELLAESPARFEEARARVSLGGALRRAGHRVDSRAPLREGYELALRCGADGLAEIARSELRASGIRLRREVATGADALTPSERRIAELAASGLSNPEIAQELFLTVKTIEMHLTRSYRKLDVRGRGGLAQALQD